LKKLKFLERDGSSKEEVIDRCSSAFVVQEFSFHKLSVFRALTLFSDWNCLSFDLWPLQFYNLSVFHLLNIKITNRGGMSIFGVCKMCKKQRCDAGHLIPSVPIPFRVIGIETHAEFLIACNCLGILIG